MRKIFVIEEFWMSENTIHQYLQNLKDWQWKLIPMQAINFKIREHAATKNYI